MKAIRLHVWGKLIEEGLVGNGRFSLLLLHSTPTTETAESLYLRFAFVTQGREEHIFPAFLLDDWGAEIKGAKLYDWFAENAHQFPRAEIFGFEQDGSQTQLFVRELEIYARWPCYVYPTKETPLAEGILIEDILLPTEGMSEPQKIKRPKDEKRPLSAARVAWWQVPQETVNSTQ